MAEVGSAFLSVIPSARGFGSKLDSEVGGELDKSGKRAGSRFGTAMKVGAAAVIGGAAVLGGFLKGAMDEAREAQKVGALTNAVIKSTGGIANVTAKDVDKLSAALSAKTGVDDEAIASGQNLLLTFTNVRNEAGKGNDIFNRATVAVQDMAAAFGGDSVSNSKMLGKALNDPIKGVTALTRVGVSFTQGQKDQIKVLQDSGNIIGAQKLILGELTKQTGGAAEATATAGDKFKVAFGNLQESVGTALLPLFDRILSAATGFVTTLTNDIGPGIAALNGYIAPVIAEVGKFFSSLKVGSGSVKGLTGPLEAAFSSIRTAVTGLVSAFAPFVAKVLPTLISAGQAIAAALLPAIKSIADTVSSQLVPAFQRILPIVAPIANFLIGVFAGAVVGAIKGIAQAVKGIVQVIAGVFNLIAAIVTGDWSAAWDAVKQIVTGALSGIIGAIKAWLNIGILGLFRQAGKFIVTSWRSLWSGVTNIAKNVGAGIQNAIGRMISGIGRLIVGGVRTYIAFWRGLFTALVQLARLGWSVLRSAFGGALAAIRTVVSSAMARIRAAFSAAWTAIKTLTVNAFNTIKNAVVNGIGKAVDVVTGFPRKVVSALGNLGSTLYNAGAQLIQGLINGIGSKIGEAVQKVQDGLSKIKGLLPGSPIKWGPLKGWNNTGRTGPGGQLVGLLATGVERNAGALSGAMAGATAALALPSPRTNFGALSGGLAASGAGMVVNYNGAITSVDATNLHRNVERKLDSALAMAGI